MKKHKEIFSLGLYKESLRRIRIPSVIFLVIISVAAILTPISYMVSVSNSGYFYFVSSVMTLRQVNPLLLTAIYLAAPILTYTAFSFLNKRSASDLYSSMPHTRLAQFTSRIAAIATALAGIIITASAISAVIHLILDMGYTLDWTTFAPYSAGCLIASLLACTITALAMSVTGTLLNNIVVAALIAYLPRIFLYCSALSVLSKYPLTAAFDTPKLFSFRINLLTGFNDLLYYLSSDSVSFYEILPYAYTLVLSLVYFVIGALLFCRRKSESAERAAPTRRLQSIYRIILTMALCLPVCFRIFTGGINDSSDLVFCFWFYIAALITYFAYELITTKKWKNLTRILPGLIIVVILNILIISGLHIAYRVEEGFCPEPEDVSYVSFTNNSISYNMYSYALNRTEEIEFRDSEIVSIVCNALERNIASLNISSIDDASVKPRGNERRTVKIKSGLVTKERYIAFTKDELLRIEEIANSMEEYRAAWLTLPKYDIGSFELSLGGKNADNNKICKEIFDILQNEVKELDVAAWKAHLSYTTNDFEILSYQSGSDTIRINISPDILPKTTAAIVAARNENSYISLDEFYTALSESNYIRDKIFKISRVTVYLPDGTFEVLSNSGNILRQSIDMDAELDVTKGFIMLQLYKYPDENSDLSNVLNYLCVPITEEYLERYMTTK